MRYSLKRSIVSLTVAATLGLAGCATNSTSVIPASIAGMSGSVRGGQQPVSGATIQLYTVSTSDLDPASTPLLTTPVLSDSSGNFNITGLYTCPSAASLVYLVATGGSPSAGVTNPQIALMAAIGPCGSLTPSTFVNINELTTVAAVYALAPYMASYSAVSSGSDTTPLVTAFVYAGYIANTNTGTTPGLNIPAGLSVPIAQVNTIADLLAACINSPGGVSGDTSLCGQFFALTLPDPSNLVSTNTISALLYLAQIPTLNTSALFNLIPASTPFQPTDSIIPPDFAVHLLSSTPFTIAPASLAFVPGVVYSTQVQTLTVTNGTSAAVNITSAAITGVNASDFAIGSGTTCGSAVPASSSCTYQISFAPTGTGARAAYFVLANSSPNPSIAVALSGSGTPGPAIPVTLTPTSATFPTTNVGSSSSVNFTLTNASYVAYSSFAFTGTSAFTTSNCPSLVIPAAGTCTITVTFSPTVAGTQSDTLSVQYYDPNTSSYTTLTSALTGLGTAPTLQFSSSSLQFPATAVGTAAQPQTVAMYNYGTGPASNLVATFSGAGASSFAETNNCPATLAVNAMCVFTITAAPTQLGALAANMTVSTAGSSGMLTLLMTGTLGSPTNNLLVPSDTQAYVPSGGSTVITLTNTGTGSINIASINASTGFSQTNTCGITVAAGVTCNVQLTAAPAPGPTAVTGTLTISSNAQALVQTVSLYTAQSVANLGSAVVGYPSSILFSDSCGAYCNVNPTTAGPDPGDFPFAGPGSCGGRVGCTIYTQFVPTAVGQRIATSTYNGYTTLLYGTGLPATGQVTSFSISAATINFGTYYLGYTSPQPVTLTLTNTGNQPVPITSVNTTSSCFSCYSFPETNTCGSSLAVGSTCTITVSYANLLGSGYAGGQLIILTYSLTPSIVIPLSADPVAPQLNFTFSSTNVTLAQTPAGTPSTAQTITLSNTGNIPMTVTTGPYQFGTANFTYATTCGTVAAGGTCTITVNGTPPSVGTVSGTLPVAISGLPYFNGGLTQNITVSVTGY